MRAYRTYVTISDPKQIVLEDLPFQPGERVEILVLSQEAGRAQTVQRLDELLDLTQALPHLQDLSDDDIASEIAAYRNGK